jgi:tellurite resistance protein
MDPITSPTTLSERDAVAALCLMAAQADGLRPEERTRPSEVFEVLGGVDTARPFKDVLLGRVRMEDAVAAVTEPGMRAYAFEMAVAACDADGHTSPAERGFLDALERALGLAHDDAMATIAQAEALADAPLGGGAALAAAGTAAGALVTAPPAAQ